MVFTIRFLTGKVAAAWPAAAITMLSASLSCESESRHLRPRSKMIVRDSDSFARKWKKFAADGIDHLVVIADFDYTLTTYHKNSGEQADTSHGILSAGGSINEAMTSRGRALFQQFYPIEQSTTLTDEEKLPHMIEWWNMEHQNFVENGLTKSLLVEAVTDSSVLFRPGFHELFTLLERNAVPTLIFSAGLSDVIRELLSKEYASWNRSVPKNVHIVSNLMRFDPSGRLVGFQDKLIHCLNKNASVIVGTDFHKQIKMEKRHNILLLGDSISDVRMAHGLEYEEDEIIRIGFHNTQTTERLDAYLEHFDVVLTEDASLFAVETFISLLKDQKV